MPNLSRNDLIAVLLSAVLLALSFPPFSFFFFIFAALVPALIRIRPREHRHNATLGFWTGLVFYTLLLYWLMHVTIPGMILLIILLSVYMAVVFVGIGYFQFSYWRILAAGFLFAAIEYIRSLGPFAFAWGYWGHSLYQFPAMLQSTYWLGVYGLSFLIAAGNQCIAELIFIFQHAWSRKSLNVFHDLASGFVYLFLGLILLAWAGNYFYGIRTIESLHERYKNGTPVKVALIQPNFSLEEKNNTSTMDVLAKCMTLSEATLFRDPDLIVWPESTVASPINFWPSVIEEITALVKQKDVAMLIGAVYGKRYNDDNWDYWNRAVQFSPKQKFDFNQHPVDLSTTPSYDKIHLVPYGEWIPLDTVWPMNMIETLIEEAGAGIFQRGKKQTIFELDNGANYAVAICYESSLPWMIHQAKKQGAEFLVNITNDAWFKRSPGLMQHFLLCIFRAAENRFPVVRVGNTGITGLIGPTGEIVERIPDNQTAYHVVEFTTIGK